MTNQVLLHHIKVCQWFIFIFLMCIWSLPSNWSMFICIPSLSLFMSFRHNYLLFSICKSNIQDMHRNLNKLHLNASDIDNCANNPCENGATCSDQVNNYTCICAAGYMGPNCSSSMLCNNFIPFIYLSDI